MNQPRKLFVGPRLRRLREQHQWNQSTLAERLGLSLSYVSQIETNQRPVTASVLLRLAEVFGGDVAQFSEELDKRQIAELDSALADRSLFAAPTPPAALARLVEQAPELVEAFLTLYQRHVRLQEEHAQTLDRFYSEGGSALAGQPRTPTEAALPLVPLPHEEVREHFNRHNNYLDELDRLAEDLARQLRLVPGQRAPALGQALAERCGVQVQAQDEHSLWLRRYDPARQQLTVPGRLSDAQQTFQMATQYALLRHPDAIDAVIRAAGFASPSTQALARQGFAHYFAGAVLLPYGDFLQAARDCRYDIELLEQRFQVSFETVCHRLSTLQRPGARGVPFYFVRIDQAGNMSKRQSATAFHFARHGGACPLWHVHEAFAQPGRILTQVAEMPDGTRFFGIARTIERGSGGFRAQRKLFAVGLGCELAHASELVYADDLRLPQDAAGLQAALIGPGCRICPREQCIQRAFPPAGKSLLADANAESLVSYQFEAS